MTTDATSLPVPMRRHRLAWRALGRLGRGWAWPMAAGLAAGAGLLQLAGLWAVVALAAGAVLLALLAQAVAAPSAAAPGARALGATAWDAWPEQEREREIVSQAVPVWRRNVEAARAHSERSMETLLASFASINDHLERAIGSTGDSPLLEAGAIDKLLAQHQPLLDTLLLTTREAVRMKDEMLDTVTGMAAALDELAELSKEVQTISRATHLLALNASVEATRSSEGGHGFAVIAREVRELAADSRKAGVGIGRRVLRLQEQMNALRQDVRRHDTSEQEISLQAKEHAREVVSSVLRSVSDVTRASRGIRTASQQVRAELEKIFMGLQSQDRLSQMLTSVTDDMGRLDLWMSGTPDPAAASAREWLARLETSYTMEELRSSHHGTAVVERQATVEFF